MAVPVKDWLKRQEVSFGGPPVEERPQNYFQRLNDRGRVAVARHLDMADEGEASRASQLPDESQALLEYLNGQNIHYEEMVRENPQRLEDEISGGTLIETFTSGAREILTRSPLVTGKVPAHLSRPASAASSSSRYPSPSVASAGSTRSRAEEGIQARPISIDSLPKRRLFEKTQRRYDRPITGVFKEHPPIEPADKPIMIPNTGSSILSRKKPKVVTVVTGKRRVDYSRLFQEQSELEKETEQKDKEYNEMMVEFDATNEANHRKMSLMLKSGNKLMDFPGLAMDRLLDEDPYHNPTPQYQEEVEFF